MPTKTTVNSTWKIVLVTSLITACFCLLAVWGAFQFFSVPSILKYTGFAESFLLKDPQAFTNRENLYALGEMVKAGTLLSVDDIWSFQSSFYQTIITVLIAVNGILAVFAFIFVKASSDDKAIEAAEKYTKDYIASSEFSDKVNAKLDGIRNDFDFSVTEIEDITNVVEPMVYDHDDDIQSLKRETKELRRYVGILTQHLAEMDVSDEEGSDLVIRK
ncbi:hypothetical protein [Shewanella sp. AC91-MNA-CIBAN-0169]|uniref:hypothetical protein n=1 Tax=Shewanella TaxID=22 RepID=UPI00332742EC